MWYVITPTGLIVYEGTKRECNAYLKQAKEKGSPEGFLSIIDKKKYQLFY